MAKIAQSRNSDFHRFATIWLALWHHYRIIASNHFSSYNPGNYSQIDVFWERSLQRYLCGCIQLQRTPCICRLTFCRTRFERLLGSLLFVLALLVPRVDGPLGEAGPHDKPNEAGGDLFVNFFRPHRCNTKQPLVIKGYSCVVHDEHQSRR